MAYAAEKMAFSLLGRLLDIEWMLARDEGRTALELARHDRALLEGRRASDPEQALGEWLEARRGELGQRTLGVRVSEALTLVHGVLIVLSLAAGAGAAEALLASASVREPTNVLHFLFATLVWPLLLLALSALALAVRGRLGRSVLLTDVYTRLLGLVDRLTRSGGHEDLDVAREWRKLRRSARRYRDIEVTMLASAAQWYPLCFHLGAAASLLGSALFSDLAFAWSTTNDSLSWDRLAAFFRVISAPWCAALEVGCVDEELVRATQFSRFNGEYALPEGAARSGAWWPALLGCLVLYGVAPRLVFSLSLRGFAWRRGQRLSERVLELRARLRSAVEVIAHRTHARPDGADLAPPVSERGLDARPGRECWVIFWRGATLGDEALSAWCERLGLRVLRKEMAGGSNYDRDAALIESSRGVSAAIVLVVEGWEAPDKATRRFVESLRRTGAPERAVFVAVLLRAADGGELSLWKDRMRLLMDPGVSVEACIEEPPRASVEARP